MSSVCRDINELTAVAQTACRLFLNECKKAGLNIFITETYRSQERQNELYEQGRTKLWDSNGNRLKIVTWTKNSRHTSRRAWDIACKGKDLYNMTTLRKCGSIAAKLGILWGGTWKNSPDYPHFEVSADWKPPVKEEEEMTQTQFNAMMDNYLAERAKEPCSKWAKDEINKAKELGITDGTEPKSFATREQVAAMIVRALK